MSHYITSKQERKIEKLGIDIWNFYTIDEIIDTIRRRFNVIVYNLHSSSTPRLPPQGAFRPPTHHALSRIRCSLCPVDTLSCAPHGEQSLQNHYYQTVRTGYCGMTPSLVTMSMFSVSACAIRIRSNGSP